MMETTEKKKFSYYMRTLHRDIGYFVIGLTLIFSISGVLLIYRDTGLLKSDKAIERQLSPNINESELGNALQKRGFEVLKTEGDVVYFANGTYNKTTGVAKYTDKALPSFLDKFNNLHKRPSKTLLHVFSTLYAISLLFLAISSFWMYKPSSKMFRRGLILAGSGLLLAIILLFL